MELTLKELQENPELESIFDEDLEKSVKIPYLIKDKILMSPGIWNGYYYKDKAIKNAFLDTDWDAKEVVSLFLDHQDDRSSEWVGWIRNPKIEGNDIKGDLVVVDKATAIKLYAGAKFGISPKVRGQEEKGEMRNFTFDNFSIVLNPAVKTAYINNMEVENMAEEEQEEMKEESKEKSESTEMNELIDKFVEIIEEYKNKKKKYPYPEEDKEKKKYPPEEEKEKKKYPEEEKEDEKKKKYPEEEGELSEDELFEIVTNSAWTAFIKKMKKEHPKMSFKAIAKAFKKQKREMSEEVSEELSEKIVKLATELKQVKAKLQEPAKMTLHAAAHSLKEEDPDKGFLQLLKDHGGGK